MDSSQAETTSPMIVWDRDFIGSFLGSLVDHERGLRLAEGSRSLLSVYPYQLDLYEEKVYPTDRTGSRWASAGRVLSDKEVKLGSGLLRSTIPFRPSGESYKIAGANYTWFGHDNVTPRSDLFRLIGPATEGRPNVVVQFTPNPLNESPGRPELLRRIGNLDSRLAGVAQAGYENIVAQEYDLALPDGRHRKMHVWAYVPRDLSVLPKLDRKSESATRPRSPVVASPSGVVDRGVPGSCLDCSASALCWRGRTCSS